MIALTSEKDKAQLREHALNLLKEDNFEGLIILVEVLKDTDFKIKDKESCLKWAVKKGYLDVVKYLVEQNANIHAQDNYALRWAATKGHLDVVKYLVESGANVSALNNYALENAALNRHLDVVEYLKEVLKNDSSHQ